MTAPRDINTTPRASAQQPRRPSEGAELIMFLEQEQLVSDRAIAVPQARLGGRAQAALWLLRIFALIVSFMVIYTFVAQLS
jgi:hypothetical protein